ncbi:hypothetical protein ACHAW6_006401 [Cyclotella cf. meneghiniana]
MSINAMPPFVAVPMKTDGQRSERLNSTLHSLMEFNRNELSNPWKVDQSEGKFKDKQKHKNHKLDPPGKKSITGDRVKKETMTNTSSHHGPSPKPGSAKSRTSRVQLVDVVCEDISTSSRRAKTKAKDSLKQRCHTRQSHNIIEEASKNRTHDGLYEEFPKKRASTLNELNQSSNVISRDEHGLFVEEVDWKNTSIDWGDEEFLTPNKVSDANVRRRLKNERNAKSMVEKHTSGQIHCSTNEDCAEKLSRSMSCKRFV